MGDPERLLGLTSDSDELERDLLGSIRDVSPPPGAKDQAWDGIAVHVAAVAVVGAATAATQAAMGSSAGAAAEAAGAGTTTVLGAGPKGSAAALGVATKAFTVKVVLGVVLAGSTVAAGGWWASRQVVRRAAIAPTSNEHVTSEPSPNVPPPPATMTTDPCDPAFPTAPCPNVATPPSSDRSSRIADEPRPRNSLGVESRMLTEARAELRSGDPRAAMSTLERLQARSPKGVLMQEREVLTIQVLAALGDTAAASRRAKEFLKAYPSSPHAPQLRRFAGDP
jgi:hypothetical protein